MMNLTLINVLRIIVSMKKKHEDYTENRKLYN